MIHDHHGVSLSVIVSLWQLTLASDHGSDSGCIGLGLQLSGVAGYSPPRQRRPRRPRRQGRCESDRPGQTEIPALAMPLAPLRGWPGQSSLLEQVELQKVDVIWRSCSHEMTLSKSNPTTIAINAIQGISRACWHGGRFGLRIVSQGGKHWAQEAPIRWWHQVVLRSVGCREDLRWGLGSS